MILSNMDNYKRYATTEDMQTAFDFLINTDLENFPMGKHIINDSVYVIKSNYKTYSLGETFWEAHEKYIDIQYIHSGSEKIAYAPADSLKTSLYFEPKDLKVLKGKVETFLHLNAGDYGIFYPEDGHMPSLSVGEYPNEVTKFVVKVKVK